MKAEIELQLKFGEDDLYNISVEIPQGKPTDDIPYKFGVKDKDNNPLLITAFGDGKHYYVAAAPPKSILAIAGDTIQNLDVKVSEGTYDTETGKFT